MMVNVGFSPGLSERPIHPRQTRLAFVNAIPAIQHGGRRIGSHVARAVLVNRASELVYLAAPMRQDLRLHAVKDLVGLVVHRLDRLALVATNVEVNVS